MNDPEPFSLEEAIELRRLLSQSMAASEKALAAFDDLHHWAMRLLAERDELREALRDRLENDFHGDQCSRCLGTWEDHRYVRADGTSLKIPCPLTKPCALVGSRHPSQPVKGTPK